MRALKRASAVMSMALHCFVFLQLSLIGVGYTRTTHPKGVASAITGPGNAWYGRESEAPSASMDLRLGGIHSADAAEIMPPPCPSHRERDQLWLQRDARCNDDAKARR